MTRQHGNSESSRHVFRGRGDGLVFLGLVVLLFIFPLARGGNRLWAVSLFDAMVFGLCALWLLCFIFGRVQMPAAVSRARYVIFLWLLWLAYIAFQFVPLPLPLAETLAPLSVEKYAAVAAVTGEPLHAAAISISRGDTFDHLLESAGLLALFLLVLFTVRGNRRLHFLAMTLVCGGLFQAVRVPSLVEVGVVNVDRRDLWPRTSASVQNSPTHPALLGDLIYFLFSCLLFLFPSLKS